MQLAEKNNQLQKNNFMKYSIIRRIFYCGGKQKNPFINTNISDKQELT